MEVKKILCYPVSYKEQRDTEISCAVMQLLKLIYIDNSISLFQT